jgi:hypothetical protein
VLFQHPLAAIIAKFKECVKMYSHNSLVDEYLSYNVVVSMLALLTAHLFFLNTPSISRSPDDAGEVSEPLFGEEADPFITAGAAFAPETEFAKAVAVDVALLNNFCPPVTVDEVAADFDSEEDKALAAVAVALLSLRCCSTGPPEVKGVKLMLPFLLLLLLSFR